MLSRWIIFIGIVLNVSSFNQAFGDCAQGTFSPAQRIAQNYSDDLRPSSALIKEIEEDLEALAPMMEQLSIRVPGAEPGEVVLRFTPQGFDQYLNNEGPVHGFIEEYQLCVESEWHSLRGVHLRTEEYLNAYALSNIAESLEGVVSSSPNGMGNRFTIFQEDFANHRYVLGYGWGDCFVGCAYELTWTFDVENGQAHLVESSTADFEIFFQEWKQYFSNNGNPVRVTEGRYLKWPPYSLTNEEIDPKEGFTDFQWRKDGEPISGPFTSQFEWESLKMEDAGRYSIHYKVYPEETWHEGGSFELKVMSEDYWWGEAELRPHYPGKIKKESSWFGVFSDQYFPWILHDQLGWVYCVGNSPENFWFYIPSLGWNWTSNTYYPFLYSFDRESWLHFRGLHFYDYGDGSRLQWRR